jgi:CDP-diacylglycerol--glycerol-3-phosphate 3-phosphatidyltransferase
MVTTILILLQSKISTWWFTSGVALTICREIAVSALREWMAEKQLRNSVQVGLFGKLKTASQMISTIFLLLAYTPLSSTEVPKSFAEYGLQFISLPTSVILNTGIISFFISLILSILSASQYFFSAFSIIKFN